VLLRWLKPRQAAGSSIELATPVTPDNELPQEIPGVNLTAGLRRTGGRKPLYLSLLHTFRTGQQSTAAVLRDALKRDDWSTAERLAHTSKGSAGTIGALGVEERAAALEAAIRERKPLETVTPLLHRFEMLLAELLVALEERLAPAPRPRHVVIPSTEVDEVCAELAMLLEEDDPDASELFDRHAEQLKRAFPEGYPRLEAALRAFDYEGAREELDKAMNSRDMLPPEG